MFVPMLFFNRKIKSNEFKKHVLQNPKILEVNLIKDEIRISFDWNKNLSVLAIVLFITALFLAEIYWSLTWWEKQENLRLETLTAKTTQVNQEVQKLKNAADEALAYKAKALAATNLLNNHVYWSNFFSWLERNTLSTVKYGDFKGDLNGTYALSAKTKTYADVSWQVKAFSNSSTTKAVNVSTASINSEEAGGEKVKEQEIDFILQLEVSPEIFKK